MLEMCCIWKDKYNEEKEGFNAKDKKNFDYKKSLTIISMSLKKKDNSLVKQNHPKNLIKKNYLKNQQKMN